MIYVISTGCKAPTKQKCITSVQQQLDVQHKHIYIEASEQFPMKSKPQNVYDTISALPGDAIVCMLDGDDWLLDAQVLRSVQEIYIKNPGCWLTYGQFIHSDGRPGFAAPYTSERYRQEPWKATHLKTFRAALYHNIVQDDLKVGGEWERLGDDMRYMFPMLEMAGAAHTIFNPKVLYVYNLASSWEWTANRKELEQNQVADRRTRALKSYSRIGQLL